MIFCQRVVDVFQFLLCIGFIIGYINLLGILIFKIELKIEMYNIYSKNRNNFLKKKKERF